MPVLHQRARGRGSIAVPRHPTNAKALIRFHPTDRHRVAALAARDTRLADLAISFPALLFALAVPRPQFDPSATIDAVLAGAPLESLARLARLPGWTRKLPPEAFTQGIGCLPDSAVFARRISNYLPTDQAGDWLNHVAHASFWCDDAFAIWVARAVTTAKVQLKCQDLRRLSLWAWFSRQPTTVAGALCQTRWNAKIPYEAAYLATDRFLDSVDLFATAGQREIPQAWLGADQYDGFTFEPILTPALLAAEAKRLSNCAMTYIGDILKDAVQLWRVQRGGETVAMLSLTRAEHEQPYPVISQLLGPGNATVSREVRMAAYEWWLAQVNGQIQLRQLPTGNGTPFVPDPGYDQAAWLSLWRPFWLAKQRVPKWLPLAPRPRHDIWDQLRI